MLPNKSGVVPASNIPPDLKATICQDGDALVSNIRPYFKKIHYCEVASGCSSDVICFRSRQKEDSPFLYSILSDDRFFEYVISGSKGTKMPRGDKNQIMRYPIPIPPRDVLNKFNQFGNYILSYVSINYTVNKTLSETRDTFLTKLISNDLDTHFD